ncbi:MAG TPA: prephenate dehydratase domain-containing protein, partial [Solirubrobacteraceae bacterium]|nr:prephenate dehydratase domain-containing protein [Solirubrobacteraceae bacterium]
EEGGLQIVGEAALSVRHSLIAAGEAELSEIDTVITHPQVPGQCERFLRGRLGHAKVLAASSTAEAVRSVVAGARGSEAALGTVLAAEIYGGTVLREGVQDRDDNETRFAWLARARGGPRAGGDDRAEGRSGPDRATRDRPGRPPLRAGAEQGEWKTSLVFWGPGADSPGWLVRCLDEFGRRGINLTKIESRPKRERMGHYMFFVDLQGPVDDVRVAEAVAGLEGICEEARVLGSYRASAPSTGSHDGQTPSLHSGASDG